MSKQEQYLAKAEKIANVVLGGAGVGSLLVFLYFFYHYTWSGQRQFDSSMGLILYYLVPAILTGLLLASLRLKPAKKINIALLGLSLTASLYTAELFLHITGSTLLAPAKPVMDLLRDANDKKKEAAELSKEFGGEIDTRSAGEFIADLRKKGVEAVPIATPSNHLFITQPDGSIKSAVKIRGQEVIPLAGVANKVTVLCNENGQWIDYRSDEHGFNNPNEIWGSNYLEIAALGDSFAHGYCVPADKNFVGLIQQRYPATLNLGVAGDGPLLMLAKVNEYLQRIRPKIVLWFYYEGNDLSDLQKERKSDLLMNYLKDGFTQDELSHQTDIDRAIMDEMPRLRRLEKTNWERRQANRGKFTPKLKEFAKLSTLRQKLGLVGGVDAEAVTTGADLSGPNMDTFREILSQAKTRVGAWGGQLYFVY